MVRSGRDRTLSAPWRKDFATGSLVADGEDPVLSQPPATLIEGGAEPLTVLALTQEAAGQVLDEVVNHWHARRLLRGHRRSQFARRIDAADRIAQSLSKKGLCASDAIDRARQDPISQALACISLAHETASRLAVPLDEVVVAFAEKHWDDRPLDPGSIGLRDRLGELAARLGSSVEGLYLQGSVALRDTTRFSDFDGIVVLGTAAEQDGEMLRLVARDITTSARLLLARDVLQHHGWLVMAPFLLEAFPEDILPLEAWREGAVISGPARITVRPFRCRILARRRLWRMVQVFRTLACDRAVNRSRSLHDDKMLLSQFMLLPSLYAQATGRYVSKRTSFSLVRAELPHLAWGIMDEASAQRRDWSQPALGRLWKEVATVVGPWEAQALWRRISSANRGAGAAGPVPDTWLPRMADLAENLLSIAEAKNRESAAT